MFHFDLFLKYRLIISLSQVQEGSVTSLCLQGHDEPLSLACEAPWTGPGSLSSSPILLVALLSRLQGKDLPNPLPEMWFSPLEILFSPRSQVNLSDRSHRAGVPNPQGHGADLWPTRSRAMHRRWVASAWSNFICIYSHSPRACITTWASPPVRSVAA